MRGAMGPDLDPRPMERANAVGRQERVAPAAAALVDWDPGDLPIVPVLLDLPDTASRDALRQRAIAWGETA